MSERYSWSFVNRRLSTNETYRPRFDATLEALCTACMVDRVIHWSTANRVKLNSEKCKELRISFAKDQPDFHPIVIDGQSLEVVKSAKLLGAKLTNNLRWNEHINDTLKKAWKRLFFLIQLKRAKVSSKDLVLF